ncbi:MAG: tRNA(Ile)-lysidine synthase, partial [Flaviaesturariibacter sp.]|nr:tRNA(Ile)-lysidine synthase [Flaviaesturariibacter sp.]
MALVDRFQNYTRSHALFQPADHLLLAVSGGLDSVVLAHLCHRCGFRLSIAHANFGLRGAESERDAVFVSELATSLSVPLHTKRFDTKQYADERKASIQVAARELRYAWFRELVDTHRLSRIATAHHQDDNVETVLMNLAKGTGIAGLTGIEPRAGNLVRPLLFATRAELEEFAKSAGFTWVEDSSNVDTKYTRNRFRADVIPALEAAIPQARHGIAATIGRMREAETLYAQAIASHKKDLLETHGAEIHLPVRKLLKKEPLATILFEILRGYGFSSAGAAEAQKLLDAETGRYVCSDTHRVIRHRDWLIIAPVAVEGQSVIVIEEGQTP